ARIKLFSLISARTHTDVDQSTLPPSRAPVARDALKDIYVLATGPTAVTAVRPASFSVSTTKFRAPGYPGDLTPSTHTYRLFMLLKSGALQNQTRRGAIIPHKRVGSTVPPLPGRSACPRRTRFAAAP